MERLAIGIILFIVSCNRESVYVYGDYVSESNDLIILEIVRGDYYRISIVEIFGDIVTTSNFSEGKIEIENNSLRLIDNVSFNSLDFKVIDNILVYQGEPIFFQTKIGVISVDSNFLCTTSIYENGQIRFLGGWKDGKQCGDWFFYNNKGKLREQKSFINC